MKDFAFTLDGDIDTSTLGIAYVDGAQRVRQQLEMKLELWQGSWFLDTEFGTPYLQSVLGKELTLSGAVATIRKSILEVEGVEKITEFAYNIDNRTRKLSIVFEVSTPYGLVSVTS